MQSLKWGVLFGWVLIFSCAQRPAEKMDKVKWLTLAEAGAELKKEKRPLLIDLYTDWCGWCKVMDKRTYSNKNVSSYIDARFYPVKFNAESRDDIQWEGRSFSFNRNYKANDFAIYLTNGQLAFPTTVIIPVDGQPQAIPGYLAPAELELIVKYFGEGKYGQQTFEEFRKNFKGSW